MEGPPPSVGVAVTALIELEQSILKELLRIADELKKPPTAENLMSPAAFEAEAAKLRAKLREHAEGVELLDTLAGQQERPADEAVRHRTHILASR